LGRQFEFVIEYKYSGLKLPARKTYNSAGYDLHAARTMTCHAGEVTIIPTGIRVSMENDECFVLYVRQSLPMNRHLMLSSGISILDGENTHSIFFGGHILVPILNFGRHDVVIRAGDPIAHGVFLKFLLSDNDIVDSEIREEAIIEEYEDYSHSSPAAKFLRTLDRDLDTISELKELGKYPRVIWVEPLAGKSVDVIFENGSIMLVDMVAFAESSQDYDELLSVPGLFEKVRVLPDGSGIQWVGYPAIANTILYSRGSPVGKCKLPVY